MIDTATDELSTRGKLLLSDEHLKAIILIVVGQWINLAAAVLAVYEWLITLDMEIRLIWYNNTSQKQKILIMALYLVNRYGVIADLILASFISYGVNTGICKTVLQAVAATTVLGIFLSEYILVLRVCAVWKMNKAIIFFLAPTYIGMIAYVLTDYYLMLRPIKFFTLLPFGGCLVDTQQSTLWISYTLLLIYDTAMVALMACPTVKLYQFSRGGKGLIRRVHDEGVIFYVFLLLVDIVSLALQQTKHDNIFFFPTPARILRSILAARTVLHIREYSSREVGGCSTTGAMSDIRFNRSKGERESEVEA